MKLNLTLNELELGSTLIGGSKDRRIEISHAAARREPFAITPIRLRDGSKRISAVATTGEVNETPRGPEIKFKPIWCRLFEVYSTPKDKLTRVVCEFEFGKYMIDSNGQWKGDRSQSSTSCRGGPWQAVRSTTHRRSRISLDRIHTEKFLSNG
jgi:hypothetical protein